VSDRHKRSKEKEKQCPVVLIIVLSRHKSPDLPHSRVIRYDISYLRRIVKVMTGLVYLHILSSDDGRVDIMF
jgi:hypothetical protein